MCYRANHKRFPLRCLLVYALLVLCLSLLHAEQASILFRHVRLFDGTQVIADTDVLVDHGKIKDLGPNLSADAALVVDGAGKTLLPGLIDSHVHVHGADTLEQALVFGVTTELDMMMPPRLEHELKSQENDQMASFFSAGNPATAPGGHGTEYGRIIPTLVRAEDAESFVEARLREGSDYIKIMYTAGVDFGRGERPTLSKKTLAAVIEAAHKHHRLAVVHMGHPALAISHSWWPRTMLL
jgi:cytosine/adenosine deaminase-related metal-dependent hydrolase